MQRLDSANNRSHCLVGKQPGKKACAMKHKCVCEYCKVGEMQVSVVASTSRDVATALRRWCCLEGRESRNVGQLLEGYGGRRRGVGTATCFVYCVMYIVYYAMYSEPCIVYCAMYSGPCIVSHV